MKTIFIVAGEISGDAHAAALVEALRELPGGGEWRYLGLGGPRLEALGEEGVENWLDEAAVLGLWEVLRKYRYFRGKMAETAARVRRARPDAVLLVDYPGFNLRLAARLRAEGYAGKLVYYISPQVWAWKRGRVRSMARLLDLMICIFPFEPELYERSGLRAVFAGHPLVDALAGRGGGETGRDPDLVALLPGSREREIAKLYPVLLDAAQRLARERPRLRFATSGATPALAGLLRRMTAEAGLEDRVEVGEGSSREIMRRAAAGAVASGTATLEAACLGLPYCLVYKVAWLTAWAARRLMSVEHLGMVNVLAGREVVAELLQERATGEAVAAEIGRLLDDPGARASLRRELEETVALLGAGGAHRRAAEALASAWGDAA